MKMKPKNLIIIGAVCFFFFFIMVSGIVTVYTSNISTNISTDLNNEKTFSDWSGDSTVRPPIVEFPVMVVYEGITVGDVHAKNPFVIDISDKDLGSLWMPLVKKSSFDFDIKINEIREFDTENTKSRYHYYGTIGLSGEYSFLGLISKKMATKLLAQKVMNEIYKKIKEEFETKPNQKNLLRL
jgi:acyl-CoA-binding protein